MTLVEYGKNTT
ncbi:Protein of unknown function [Bacillus mycoides]|nr:Protein of unknown function [Bacillus mycoides]